ncbi:MAG: beta-lactamase [Nonomuraea muscovyensis]|nr:beta-lactamase [Nonomuraea muscovyensis]
MTANTLQERVQRAVDELVASGRELGVQVAAYLHGELVVDACAGVADPGTGRPVTPDTPFFSFSSGKGMTATAVHVLAERGELDYDLRIADVWPEYARHGKGGTTLRHALTHSAGVPALPAGTTAEDFTDWQRMCAVVAGSEPLWEPGTAHGYHAWTYGWLVGETVRRATGRTLAQVLAEDVAEPLKVPGELFFGVPGEQQPRLAVLRDGNWSAVLEHVSSAVPRLDLVAPPGVRPDAVLGSRPDVLRADVPAVGTMTARAAARMYAALIGEVDGVRLVSPERLAEMTAVAVQGPDWVFGADAPRTLGYALEAGGAMFGASGSGGSLAGAAPALGLSVAATKNLLTAGDDDPMEDLRALILEAVS